MNFSPAFGRQEGTSKRFVSANGMLKICTFQPISCTILYFNVIHIHIGLCLIKAISQKCVAVRVGRRIWEYGYLKHKA